MSSADDFSAIIPGDSVILSGSICARWRDAIGEHLATAMRNGNAIDPAEHEAARNVFTAAARYEMVTKSLPIDSKSLPIELVSDNHAANLEDEEISTAQAMQITGLSMRGVTKAIESGRLVAQREGGRWRVSLESAARLKRTA